MHRIYQRCMTVEGEVNLNNQFDYLRGRWTAIAMRPLFNRNDISRQWLPNWSVAIAGSAKVGTGGRRDHCQFPLAHHPKRKNA